MLWFKKRECDHSESYDKLYKRWIDVDARVTRLEVNEDNLRNMARKIQKNRAEADAAAATESDPKDIKDSVLVAV